ncbi:sensor histidine kinase [Agromyces aerolatus]|uniref:sensor histidine kinase n=1 Tax=Agromyces sp. LY-1074 TaxID=3074080 RepID=UPI00285ED35C|nr:MULTISPECIES: ATP-binding protein [unclassified Agromyces]MDR5699808.1 histidine kinase [Agromyces sp. LY-1074]MDR5706380.1 histidine kinase [Agromyces sp. LY-1358]
MKRIHKERDRLLRRVSRVTGITGAAVALACLLVPGTLSGLLLLAAAAAVAAVGAFVFLATQRGSLVLSAAAVAASIAAIAFIGSDAGADPVALAAISSIAGVAAASTAIPVIVRRHGIALAVTFAVSVIVTLWVLALTGEPVATPILTAIAGWLACGALGIWIDRAIARTAERIAEVGRAHEAERLASELEAQQRQDARVLHDTVLATLSLLAHSGVGVGPAALRQQAGDDARLLRLLRLGAPLDSGGSSMFSPDQDADALGTTFESVRQRFARMGLDVNWHGAGQLVLPRDTLDALLGALGECLENVRRHSGVNEADVTVTDDDHTVRAMVSDAGTGFEPALIDSGRLGFAESVVGRLTSVGGRARVFSSPGAGTTVMLEVPKP